jgi:hypothetical protein
MLSLVNGARFAFGWTKSILDFEQVCSRPVRRIAVRRELSGTTRTLERREIGLWPGLNTYEWCEDIESGLVLSFSAIADDTVVASMVCESVELNSEIPTSLFNDAFPDTASVVSY